MPTVSQVPGTTAAPIRNGYGSGKGELIDLPGLKRRSFHDYVLNQYHADLVMRRRVSASQYNLRPGQSAVISNLVRITPKSDVQSFQVFPFVPLPCHVMETSKAEAVTLQSISLRPKGIATPEAANRITSAGLFRLQWDITKQRYGQLNGRIDLKTVFSTLPFMIQSCDLLLEGLGWVEISAQTRKADANIVMGKGGRDLSVEVFTPDGLGVGHRRPLTSFKHMSLENM